MTVEALAQLVADMRAAQREYFRTRTQGALEHSRALEKQIDQTVRDILGALPFFPEGGGE